MSQVQLQRWLSVFAYKNACLKLHHEEVPHTHVSIKSLGSSKKLKSKHYAKLWSHGLDFFLQVHFDYECYTKYLRMLPENE